MSAPKSETPIGRFRAPDTFVILFCVALLAWLARALVPAGQFSVGADGAFALDTFETIGRSAAPLFLSGDDGTVGFLDFLFEGLIAGDRYSATIGLMAFLLIVGGAFGIILRTGAMEAALNRLLQRTDGEGGTGTDGLIASLFVLFSLAGAVFGMGEEAIVFVLILAPGLIRAGYDSLTVLLVTYVATQIGFATSWMNPFSVVVAQGIAGLDVMSGAGLRMAMWAVFTIIGAGLTWRYAHRVRIGQIASRTSSIDAVHLSTEKDIERFNLGHALILLIILAGIGWVAWGVAVHQYYFSQIAAQFFAMGLAAALVAKFFKLGGMGFNECGEAFKEGAVQLAPAALIIGFAKGVVILLGGDAPGEPSVLNTALYGMASVTEGLPAAIAASGMLLFTGHHQYLRGLRFRTGRPDHAPYGAAVRSDRCRASDRRARFSTGRRPHEPHCAVLRRSDGMSGGRARGVGDLDRLYLESGCRRLCAGPTFHPYRRRHRIRIMFRTLSYGLGPDGSGGTGAGAARYCWRRIRVGN